MTDPAAWSFETRQIHAGTSPDPTTGARALPIYATTAYQFRDSKHAADLFALAEMGNIYTRIMNPTQDALEQRVASLEGGVAALAVSSGQSATTLALLNIAEAGDHIVASASLYGGTYNLLHHSLPKLGVTVSFVEDPDDPEAWQALVQDNTKAFFGETIGNPKGDLLDIEAVAAVAHRNGVPLIVDNTIATPYLIRPFEFGADVVVHSATKYLGGHGTAIAGLIVDGGGFDWTSGKFPGFTTPDPTYNGVVYASLGAPAFALKARVQLLRDLGPAISPFNAFLVVQGIETLSLRMERHVQNTLRVAELLEAHDEVDRVNYPGLRVVDVARGAAEVRAEGRRCGAHLRAARRPGGGAEVRRGPRAAQPRGQHRRRPQPGDPPGLDHPLAADAGGAAHHRRHARAWCASRSGSRGSRTSWPTWRPGFRAAKSA